MQNDDVDAPSDGELCTNDFCDAGIPNFVPQTQGFSCSVDGGTDVCSSSGQCLAVPYVTGTVPADGTTGISPLTSVAITFNTAMSPASLTVANAFSCAGTIQLSSDDFSTCLPLSSPGMSNGDRTATVTPVPALSFGTLYRTRVGTGATSDAGIALAAPYFSDGGFVTRNDYVCGPSVVISQLYGAGNNSGAVLNADYVELHNRAPAAADLSGWSLQYASGTSATPTWNVLAMPTGTTIGGGRFMLVQVTVDGGTGGSIVTPDLIVLGQFNLSATVGKVALVRDAGAIVVNTLCPSGGEIVDFVGYGSQTTTNGCWEGSGTAADAGTSAGIFRRVEACQDSNDNRVDFTYGPPVPRNSATSANVCSCSVNETASASELDFCNLQFPSTLSVQAGMPSALVYARAFETGVTEGNGVVASLAVQIGYGPINTNPQSNSGWLWSAAAFNVDVGNDDEYQLAITAPSTVGTYAYGARVSLDGVRWTYCDLNGAGSNTGLVFTPGQLGVMTVTP